jgi:hypothetical protein
VAGGSPRFEAISYFDLWDAWADSDDPQLRAHAAALRGRYEVPAWAWDGVQWVNGRLSNAMLLDMLEEDPEVERAMADRAVAAAIERGISPEDAALGWAIESRRRRRTATILNRSSTPASGRRPFESIRSRHHRRRDRNVPQSCPRQRSPA